MTGLFLGSFLQGQLTRLDKRLSQSVYSGRGQGALQVLPVNVLIKCTLFCKERKERGDKGEWGKERRGRKERERGEKEREKEIIKEDGTSCNRRSDKNKKEEKFKR